MATFLPRASKRLRLSAPVQTILCPRCSLASTPRLFSNTPFRPSQPQDDKSTTHFGYETIPAALKETRVGAVFSSVASSYDTMNDLMSLGIHRLWKDYFVRHLDPGSPTSEWNMLDIAGGTGDIALRLLDHASLVNGDSKSRVTVSDINASMLAEGRKRLSAGSEYVRQGRVSFLEANAEDLKDVESGSVDLYTVAFGIRNFTDKDRALREAYRVLKPGGVFACLEFSKVNNGLLDAVYKRWSFGAIPLIGQVVAGDRDSYQYLVESIDRFPSQTEFAGMIEKAGFVVPGWTERDAAGGLQGKGWVDLTGGIAAIHKGVKPA